MVKHEVFGAKYRTVHIAYFRSYPSNEILIYRKENFMLFSPSAKCIFDSLTNEILVKDVFNFGSLYFVDKFSPWKKRIFFLRQGPVSHYSAIMCFIP